MRKVIYHVATSIDGYISGLEGDISGFLPQEPALGDYLASLRDYDTVLMGYHTYAAAFAAGLEPGQPVYPHMRNCVFSSRMVLPEQPPSPDGPVQAMWRQWLGFSPDEPLPGSFELVSSQGAAFVQTLKQQPGSDIYLCGGGHFAGYLWAEGLIDEILLKLYPVVLGQGIPLLGSQAALRQLALREQHAYAEGMQLLRYEVRY